MPKTLKPFNNAFFNEKRLLPIETSLLIDETLGFSVLGMPKTLKPRFSSIKRLISIENDVISLKNALINGFSWFQLVSVGFSWFQYFRYTPKLLFVWLCTIVIAQKSKFLGS